MAKSKQQQQQAGKQAREKWAKITIVLLRIPPKFWWMMPMGVRDNHTNFEQETQRWHPRMGVARGGPSFQKLSKIGEKFPFFWQFVCLPSVWRGCLHWNYPR